MSSVINIILCCVRSLKQTQSTFRHGTSQYTAPVITVQYNL